MLFNKTKNRPMVIWQKSTKFDKNFQNVIKRNYILIKYNKKQLNKLWLNVF